MLPPDERPSHRRSRSSSASRNGSQAAGGANRPRSHSRGRLYSQDVGPGSGIDAALDLKELDVKIYPFLYPSVSVVCEHFQSVSSGSFRFGVAGEGGTHPWTYPPPGHNHPQKGPGTRHIHPRRHLIPGLPTPLPEGT